MRSSFQIFISDCAQIGIHAKWAERRLYKTRHSSYWKRHLDQSSTILTTSNIQRVAQSYEFHVEYTHVVILVL